MLRRVRKKTADENRARLTAAARTTREAASAPRVVTPGHPRQGRGALTRSYLLYVLEFRVTERICLYGSPRALYFIFTLRTEVLTLFPTSPGTR